MKNVHIATLGFALLASTAHAGELKLVGSAAQVAFPNSGPRGDIAYNEGEYILRVPLLWTDAATLSDPVTITADNQWTTIEAGTALPAATLKSTDGEILLAFCTPRKGAERKAEKGILGTLLGGGSLWRAAIRSATDGQFCLIDADRDGHADHSVMINAGTPAARTPVAITPTPLAVGQLVPISSNDEVRIRLTDIAAKSDRISFEFEILQQGEKRGFTSFSTAAGSAERFIHINGKKGWPSDVNVAGGRFEIVNVSGPEKQISLRWPENADKAYAFAVPDGLKVYVQPY